MKNNLDNFLLSFLWLCASTLCACFWFNIKYGFNLFSGAHWQHLAYMQAAQNPVTPTFYISLVVTAIIMILGLYILRRPLRPRQTHNTPQPNAHIPNNNITMNTPVVPHNNTGAVSTNITTAPTPPTQSPIPLSRPPRLNIGAIPALPPRTQTPNIYPQPTIAPTPRPTSSQPEWPEITQIFESAGYVLKPAPRIGDLQTTLFAIGTNETLWIGAVGVPTTSLQTSIDTLTQIFQDTLDDIIINVNGFVISAPDANTPGANNILTFTTPSDLREYISQHRNPPLPDDDLGNFDAFSTYISTVIEYISKI